MGTKMWKCTESVIMEDDGSQAFTEGKSYRPYSYLLQDGYDFRKVICAKNDQGERHIVKDKERLDNDTFFEKHFVEVVVEIKKMDVPKHAKKK